MIIKDYISKTSNFVLKRLAELIGLIIIFSSILLLISLASYSPQDPNFIFPENQQINNILGLKGSYIADIFFQSIGIISFLIPFSLFFTGLSILVNKKVIIFIENIFFIILYILLATIFFSIFYNENYWLVIYGNNGFVGNLISETVIFDLLNFNITLSYYLLIIFILLFFFISSDFKIKYLLKIYFLLKNLFISNNNIQIKDKQYEEEKVENHIFETRVQENLFSNNKKPPPKNINKIKLPLIDFLKKPEKLSNKNEDERTDGEALEKILLDFGVEGKIKKISHGPVVSLNEFEPAAGVKVSKIINLSEDIARNTSSESARIATIPGSNTVGIELPKVSRENVFLREIISDKNFKKKKLNYQLL